MKDEMEAFLRRAAELHTREYQTKKHTRQCHICNQWVHKDIQDCEPCAGASPTYSMKHKF